MIIFFKFILFFFNPLPHPNIVSLFNFLHTYIIHFLFISFSSNLGTPSLSWDLEWIIRWLSMVYEATQEDFSILLRNPSTIIIIVMSCILCLINIFLRKCILMFLCTDLLWCCFPLSPNSAHPSQSISICGKMWVVMNEFVVVRQGWSKPRMDILRKKFGKKSFVYNQRRIILIIRMRRIFRSILMKENALYAWMNARLNH